MIEVTQKHVFFFKDWLSNFHFAPFEMITNNNRFKRFATSEQAFMFQKAIYFGDLHTAKKILAAKTPLEAKQLGRNVLPYNDEQWSVVRYDCMFSCNYNKYDQNPELKKRFMNPLYDNKMFVEVSPFDSVWGIHLDRSKYSLEYLDDESNWKGQNLLGKVLTQVYNYFKEQENGETVC